MESPRNEPLQLLQHKSSKFIACDLRKSDLKTCRSSLKSTCQYPIKVHSNNRVYLACKIDGSQSKTSEWSHPAKSSKTLPKLNSRKNENLCNNVWQWSGAKYCIAPSTKQSSPQKVKSKKDLQGFETKKFEYQPEVIRRAVLRVTNMYRKLHRASPLKMDNRISMYAQAWANHLAFNRRLETRPSPIFGENSMCVRKSLFSVDHVLKLWYQEKYHYDYINPKFSPYTGHFTQMVWRNTEYLGVGVASNDCYIWIVCNYDPPGNTRGHFQENVLPRRLLYYESSEEDKKKKKSSRTQLKRRQAHCQNPIFYYECTKSK